MSWLYRNAVVQRLGETAFLYDLSKIRGTSAILNRIPENMSGVYAWYRNFKIDASALYNSDVFVSNILQELYKPHCITRETRLPPSHKLIVKPETIFPRRKQEALKQYSINSDFRELLITLLNNCLLFQQPLYIGKANNLQNRIRNHLGVDSVLRERLKNAEHNIDECRLLIVGCSPQINDNGLNCIEEDNNKFNKPLYGLKGQYTLAEGISLPYFLCTMPIERAINELKIAEQVPPSLEAQWSIKELFQREIDEDRILQDIIKSYLLDSKKLKFFNAITIVLMPKGKDEKIQDSFQESQEETPPPIPWDGSNQEDAQWNHLEAKKVYFGGVQFVSIGQQARLRWDENKVLAVAVDGQHRLWALRTFREHEKFRGVTLRATEKLTHIPVIFVLLHQKVGFDSTQSQINHSIKGISRELFTDLNKNAKTVDRARELILDDKSIHARCVRTLLTDSTAQDAKDLLPLSLVRWQDDVNKFDNSYYLNSLVHLDLLVKALLDLNEPKDPMEERQIRTYIKDINQALGINGKEVEYEERLSTGQKL